MVGRALDTTESDFGMLPSHGKIPTQHPRQWTRFQQIKWLRRRLKSAVQWRDNWRHK